MPGILGAYKRLVVPSAEEGFSIIRRVTVTPGNGFAVAPLALAPAPA